MEAPRVAPEAVATQGLYERHAAKIQSYCHHQLGSREEAEDAVQTTFMNAFRALGRGVVPEAESAWLFKIAENVCLSRRRSSWRRGRIESPSDFDVIEEIVPGPSRQRDELIGIEEALAAMPEQQRRAILLREWQGLSYREVAEELEISQSAVETLIFRARRSLAQGLEQPDTIKPAKRKSFRRALHVVDFGTVIVALKALLTGSAAAQATAAAVAVTAAAGTAATVGYQAEHKHPRPAALTEAVVAPVEKRAVRVVAASRPVPSVARASSSSAPVAAVVPEARAPKAADSGRQADRDRAARSQRRQPPAAPKPVPPAVAPTPVAAAPVAVAPEAAPVQEAPVVEAAPAAEKAPLAEAAPAAERGKDEGRKSDARKDKQKDGGKDAVAPTAPPLAHGSMHAAAPAAPASIAVVAPVSNPVASVEEGKGQAKRDGKESNRDRKDKRTLTVAAPVEPVAEAMVPQEAPAPDPVVSEQSAEVPAAAPAEESEFGEGDSKRKRRGRNK